jgi:diguanylate cyclase (GGDEF)-like protein
MYFALQCGALWKLCANSRCRGKKLLALLVSSAILAAPLAAGTAAKAQQTGGSPGHLRTITTALEAHSLSTQEAARAYPIHLRGVVTCIDPSDRPDYFAGFIHDATGSIYVVFPVEWEGKITSGSEVDLQGVTGPGTFAPIIENANLHVMVIGSTTLPKDPPQETMTLLATGSEDAKWVAAEGIVHSIIEHERYITLQMVMTGGVVGVSMLREQGVDYNHLVDARILVHANAAPMFNRVDQIMGVRLMAPGLSAVQILEASQANPYQQPVVLIDDLMRWNQLASQRHRVHVRGRVTMLWPGVLFCIRDTTRGICAQTLQETHLALGEIADVVGFASAENGSPTLSDALYRGSGRSEPVEPVAMTAEQAQLGKNDSEVVQIDGQLVGNDPTASDTSLLLLSGHTVFTAILPKNLSGPAIKDWKIGSHLRITGICSLRLDSKSRTAGEGVATTKSFQVLMRSPQDVVVVEAPSWWTPVHALIVLAMALTGTLCVLAWVMALRKRLKQQTIVLSEKTKLLQESEERFRHMALHDSLTGLASRLLFQDRLYVAIESAKRHRTGLAVFMLDLDKFKEVNDQYGHAAGDEVLRITADRILGAVRSSDTVARLGGDEFVTLLPDLSISPSAEMIAARIVAALMVPIAITGHEVSVTVSIGVCIASTDDMDADSIVKKADEALYRAKEHGRNRFELYAPRLVSAQK